jgi:hypothetical protein
MSSVTESKQFSNISATTAAFTLKGGKYGITVKATGASGTIDLKALAVDGVTWVAAITQITGAAPAVYVTADLPPGQYRVEIGTYTGVYVAITSVPS